MESHVQVCGWEVTVYVNVASKVAPFHVQTDFLRSTAWLKDTRQHLGEKVDFASVLAD